MVQDGKMEEKCFINYMEYLRYWKKPEYLKYLFTPRCLDILELLLTEEVRKQLIKDSNFALSLDV